MGTTTRGIPYPEPTDRVADGATAMQDLAEAVDTDLAALDVELAAILGALTGADVATEQTTTSTSYADLGTAGPAVTVTIGSTGRALVYTAAKAFNSTADEVAHISVAVSGATTIAATDAASAAIRSPAPGGPATGGSWRLLTGLTPGSTTFTAKYRVNAGTGYFSDRRLIVLPL